MVDKMMRIAGRGYDGTAKAITTDKDGILKVSDDGINEVERGSYLGSGLWEEFYCRGVENESFSQGYSLGSGAFLKNDSYMKLTLGDNPSARAERSINSEFMIDLTDFSSLFFEYEFEGTTSYNSRICFSVASTKNTSYPVYTKERVVIHNSTDGVVNNIEKINVSDINKQQFIKVHLLDSSQAVSVPASLKITRIWGERTKSKNEEVSILANTSTQIERSSKLGSGLWEEFYYDGVEKVDLTQGYFTGSGLVSKEEDYVKLELLNNPTSVAEQSLTTTKPVDLTDFANLYLDYEFEGTPSYNSHITFKVGSTQNTSYPTYTKGKEITHQGNDGVVRNVIKLNVADVKNYEYIFIHLTDRSKSISVPATLKIKAIWGERLKPKSLSVGGSVTSTIQGKDYETGEALEITAVKGDNGKGAMYVVDAAPYGYSSETQSIRTSGASLYKIPTLSKTQLIQGNTSLETDVLFVDNIRQLFINIYNGYASSPFEIEINYYLSNGTTKVESKLLKDVTPDMNIAGTSIKHEVESAFISLTIKNKSSNSRTFTLETFGG